MVPLVLRVIAKHPEAYFEAVVLDFAAFWFPRQSTGPPAVKGRRVSDSLRDNGVLLSAPGRPGDLRVPVLGWGIKVSAVADGCPPGRGRRHGHCAFQRGPHLRPQPGRATVSLANRSPDTAGHLRGLAVAERVARIVAIQPGGMKLSPSCSRQCRCGHATAWRRILEYACARRRLRGGAGPETES